MPAPVPCPCGGHRAASYDECCGPLLRRERLAGTAEELMRSRYTAFAVGDADHLWRTWHPRTRPPEVTMDPHLVWRRLTVLRTEAGEADDDTGVVEFRADHDSPRGWLHEVSRFERRAGRWFYVAAE